MSPRSIVVFGLDKLLSMPVAAKIPKDDALPSVMEPAAVVVPRNPKKDNAKVRITAVTKIRAFAGKVRMVLRINSLIGKTSVLAP
jgi:hypothetical protein